MTPSAGDLRVPRETALAFLRLFAAGYLVLEALYFLLPDPVLREVVYGQGIVRPAVALIHWIAPAEQVQATGAVLRSPRAALEIVRGCDGAGVLFLLVAAIVAVRAGVRRTLAGCLGAFVLVYTINQVRIVGLYFVVAYRSEWFLPLHTYLVPGLLVVIACVYFAWWTPLPAATADEPATAR